MKKSIILNVAKLDFDRRLDLSSLSAVTDVTVYDDSTPDETIERVEGAEIVVTKELPVGADLLSRFPSSVRLICEAGTGYNNIDIAAARQKGIAVCNVPAYSTEAVAQLVITYILNFSCSLVPQQRMLWEGDLGNFTGALRVPHFELGGKTLGIIGGSGAIGGRVMEIALVLGMDVLVYSRTPRTWSDPKVRSVPLADLLGRSDFVSIHSPLTPETRHLIDKGALEAMKPSAYLINTARGAIVRENDLVEALRNGTIAGAALDVQDPEPPEPESPLYRMGNVILTPHIGWKRLQTRQRLMNAVAGNIQAFIQGRPVNIVN